MKPSQTLTLAAALATGLAGAALAQGSPSSGTAPSNPQITAPSTAPSASAQMPQASGNANQPGATAQAQATPTSGTDRVKTAQQKLQAAGLYQGPVDGRMDPDTRAAIARFQQQNGLPRSEKLDNQTFARLMNGGTSGYGSTAPNAAAPSAGGNGNASLDQMQAPQQRQAFATKQTRPRRLQGHARVKQVQEQLRAKGLYKGRIDGIMGRQTRHAMRMMRTREGVGVGSSMPAKHHVASKRTRHNTARAQSMMPPDQNPSAGAGGSGPATGTSQPSNNNRY